MSMNIHMDTAADVDKDKDKDRYMPVFINTENGY
jgi:hypothetical protein